MMPSRGLRALRGRTSQLHLSQCRNLSSSTLPSRLNTAHRVASLRPSQSWRPIAIMPTVAAYRHASTSQTPAPPTSTPPSDFPNLDTITLDTIEINPASDPATLLPEQIGYLHQLGIDYGWGPSTLVQYAMEGIHVYGGLPWWAAILTTSLVARLLLFPAFVKSSDSMARTAALGEVLKPFDQRMKEAQKEGDTQGVLLAMKRKGEVKKRAGIISMPKQLAPMLLQGVIAYCGIKLTRAMAALPVPGLHDGGFLWLEDLTLTDGYLLLPILMAGTIHVVARMGGETGAMTQLGPMMRPLMLYIMPGLIAVFMAFQPAAVCVWFCGSGAIGMGQGLLLRNEAVRKALGMAPNFVPKPGMEPTNTLTAMLEDRFPAMKEQRAALNGGAPPKPSGPYINPTYQPPRVQRTSSKTIDTTLVTGTKGEDMVQPGTPPPKKPSIREKWSNFKAMSDEQLKKENEKKAFKRRAELYEQRAKEKGRR
ncbi:unnamed protein product [Zymoseptoria tritici ST99CH_1E4]|uniref:Membrane insertase YidC/Oxa/ALB C-terminal domain-containing protein n=2 Tax=Zymoseptoria tritici TaxID=1047171 RepID=A0A2H1GUW7_ZYMTR|nr:unnamed protein product [Zymoseptoria tritici ST99CH_1E4]